MIGAVSTWLAVPIDTIIKANESEVKEMIKNLNKETKKAQGFIWAYNRSHWHSLSEAYDYFSEEKRRSFNDIWFRCKQQGGNVFDLKVISRSCNFYTTGYRLGNDLIIDTYANTYLIENVF